VKDDAPPRGSRAHVDIKYYERLLGFAGRNSLNPTRHCIISDINQILAASRRRVDPLQRLREAGAPVEAEREKKKL